MIIIGKITKYPTSAIITITATTIPIINPLFFFLGNGPLEATNPTLPLAGAVGSAVLIFSTLGVIVEGLIVALSPIGFNGSLGTISVETGAGAGEQPESQLK